MMVHEKAPKRYGPPMPGPMSARRNDEPSSPMAHLSKKNIVFFPLTDLFWGEGKIT